MARRDPMGIRLLTRRGNDWSARFPLIVEAGRNLPEGRVPSDRRRGGVLRRVGLLRQRRKPAPFSLLTSWNWMAPTCGECIQVRTGTLASILGKRRPGVPTRPHTHGVLSCCMPASWASKASSKRLGSRYRSGGLAQVQWTPPVKRDGIEAGEVRAMPQICRSSHYNYAERRSIVLEAATRMSSHARGTRSSNPQR